MRITLAPGVHVQRFVCRFCGQAEMLTEGEEAKCSNCGQPLEVIEKPVIPETGIFPVKELEFPVEAIPPKRKKKPGRKPKPEPGTCGTCEKAMKAEVNYTCKETCDMVWPDHTCKHYKAGVPVGERAGSSYTGNEKRKKREEGNNEEYEN